MRSVALVFAGLALSAGLSAQGIFSGPDQALALAGRDFRAGDFGGARLALDPYAAAFPRVAREDLALRFLAQDFSGVLALARAEPPQDDEAGLWVARSDAALGRWPACLDVLTRLREPQDPWPLWLKAEALSALRDPGAPQACARALSAAAGSNLEALCALQAAEEAEADGDTATAESCYKLAQHADPSYSLVNACLAKLYLAEGRWQDAQQRLERELAVDPRSEGPHLALAKLLAAQPELSEDQGQGLDTLFARFETRAALRVPPLGRLSGEPLVRVALLSGGESVVFRLGAPMWDQAHGVTLAADSTWVVCGGDGIGALTLAPFGDKPGPAAQTFAGPLRLSPLDPSGTFGIFHLSHGLGYFFAGASDRYYRGLLEISSRPEGLLVVDELGLEALLTSVVPSEIPKAWPMQTLEAQAIAARTAAWAWLGHNAREGYDFSETREAYAGAGVEDSATDAAVAATAGMVLENGRGGFASTYYMDDSGGHTLPASAVWPGPAPDSVGVDDCPAGDERTEALFPLSAAGLLHYLDDPKQDVQGWSRDEGHGAWRWILRLTPEELGGSVDRLAPVGRPLFVLGRVRDAGGTLESARIAGDLGWYDVAGDRIRTALKGLKSNLFYVEPRLDAQGRPVAFLFHGGGWGHGVGLSQFGAKAMALAGLDDHAILRHYFPEDRIVRRYPDSSGMPPGASVFDPIRGRVSRGKSF